MTKVKILRALCTHSGNHSAGDIADLPDNVAQSLIAAGKAEPVNGAGSKKKKRTRRTATADPSASPDTEAADEVTDAGNPGESDV